MAGRKPGTGSRALNAAPRTSGNQQAQGYAGSASTQPSSSVTTSPGALAEAVSSIRLEDGRQALSLAARPAISGPRRGNPISLLTNHFSFDIKNIPDFIEYGLKVRCLETNDEVTGGIRRRILTILLRDRRFSHSFTDYATKIFSAAKFPLHPEGSREEVYQIAYYNEAQSPLPANTAHTHSVELVVRRQLPMEKFCVHVADHGVRSFDQLDEYVGLLDMMLSRWPNQHTGMQTLAGGSKCFDVTKWDDLTEGLVAIAGFFRRMKSSLTAGLLLNINRTSAAFFRQSLRVDVVIARFETVIARSIPGNLTINQKVRELSKRLRGMRFQTNYNGIQVRTFCEIAHSGTNLTADPTGDMVTFQNQQGQVLTVNQHFRHNHHGAIPDDDACLIINCAGANHRALFIPSSVGYVLPGQHYSLLLDDTVQATEMIRWACRKPLTNKNLITENGLPQLALGQAVFPNGPERLFSVRSETKMLSIEGRMLAAPFLMYQGVE